MAQIIVTIDGAGPHTLIAADPNRRAIVNYMFLTFSHEETRAQLVKLCSDDETFLASYVLDGGEIEYTRRADEETRVQFGEPFVIEMTAGLAAAGIIQYTWGAS